MVINIILATSLEQYKSFPQTTLHVLQRLVNEGENCFTRAGTYGSVNLPVRTCNIIERLYYEIRATRFSKQNTSICGGSKKMDTSR